MSAGNILDKVKTRMVFIIRSPHCLKLEAFLSPAKKCIYKLKENIILTRVSLSEFLQLMWIILRTFPEQQHATLCLYPLYTSLTEPHLCLTIYFYITKDIFVYMTYIFTTATMWSFLTFWKQPERPSVTTEVKKKKKKRTRPTWLQTFYLQFFMLISIHSCSQMTWS